MNIWCWSPALLSATVNGDPSHDDVLSYLPGQRLSRCTCPGESHPGPVHSDGTYVGRAAPEIDVFEAQVGDGAGHVSQSGQWAPFNAHYEWFNTSDNLIIPDPDATQLNAYTGGVYQQATSGISKTNQECYELEGGCYSVYGFEYKPGFDDAWVSSSATWWGSPDLVCSYIGWINDGKLAWQLNQPGMDADSRVEISSRPIPPEPMVWHRI